MPTQNLQQVSNRKFLGLPTKPVLTAKSYNASMPYASTITKEAYRAKQKWMLAAAEKYQIYIYIWARELFGAPWEAIHVQSSDPNVSNPSTIHLIQLYHLMQLVHLCTHISFANISTIYLNISNL